MVDCDPLPEALGSELAGGVARETERVRNGRTEERIAERAQHKPECAPRDLGVLMSGAQLGDQRLERLQDRVESVAIAGEDHPGGERPGALTAEGVERLIDDVASVGLSLAGALDGAGNAGGDGIGDGASKRALEPRGRAEMVKEVGMGAADLGSHGLKRNGLRPALEKKPPRSLDRGGTAFFGAKTSSLY